MFVTQLIIRNIVFKGTFATAERIEKSDAENSNFEA